MFICPCRHGLNCLTSSGKLMVSTRHSSLICHGYYRWMPFLTSVILRMWQVLPCANSTSAICATPVLATTVILLGFVGFLLKHGRFPKISVIWNCFHEALCLQNAFCVTLAWVPGMQHQHWLPLTPWDPALAGVLATGLQCHLVRRVFCSGIAYLKLLTLVIASLRLKIQTLCFITLSRVLLDLPLPHFLHS